MKSQIHIPHRQSRPPPLWTLYLFRLDSRNFLLEPPPLASERRVTQLSFKSQCDGLPLRTPTIKLLSVLVSIL